MCNHLYHKPRLLSRYAFASAVFGVLVGLEHILVPVVQARPGLRQEVDHGWQGSLRPSLRVTVSELGKLFDGTEQLVSVAILPWFVRQEFLP
jgi:hypothetical protein